MRRVVKLTESQLRDVVQKVINEQSTPKRNEKVPLEKIPSPGVNTGRRQAIINKIAEEGFGNSYFNLTLTPEEKKWLSDYIKANI